MAKRYVDPENTVALFYYRKQTRLRHEPTGRTITLTPALDALLVPGDDGKYYTPRNVLLLRMFVFFPLGELVQIAQIANTDKLDSSIGKCGKVVGYIKTGKVQVKLSDFSVPLSMFPNELAYIRLGEANEAPLIVEPWPYPDDHSIAAER